MLVNYITDPKGTCDREKKLALISLVRMCTKEELESLEEILYNSVDWCFSLDDLYRVLKWHEGPLGKCYEVEPFLIKKWTEDLQVPELFLEWEQ